MATLGSVGLFTLVISVVSGIIQYVVTNYMMGDLTTIAAAADPIARLAVFGTAGYWGKLASSVLLGSLMLAGSLDGLIKAAWGKPTSFAECISAGVAKTLPVLGLYILWFLGVGLGWVLLVIPGLMLMTMWSAAMPALVGENIGVIAAFGRSRELTRGSRWNIFGTLLIFLIAIYGILFGILGAIVGGGMMQFAAKMNANPLTALAAIPVGWLFSVLLNALLASIYVETVSIKEGSPTGHLAEVFD
ncbi:MAG: hypothetical protein ABIW31_08560 [Novosphingobium sp.]